MSIFILYIVNTHHAIEVDGGQNGHACINATPARDSDNKGRTWQQAGCWLLAVWEQMRVLIASTANCQTSESIHNNRDRDEIGVSH